VQQDPSSGVPVPRIALLGFCDRAETITAGQPVFWHLNLMGVSLSRVFFFFPVNLRGFKLLLAVYRPTGGDSFRLIFRGRNGGPPFDLMMRIEKYFVSEGDGTSITETEHTTGMPVQGWTLLANELSTDLIVNSPGAYDVFLATGDTEQFVATATFAHAPVAPFTPEEITAIRSDPLASKFVRAEWTCKFCGSALRAYAGVERSASLESQGFRLNSEIQEDQFACSCGKMQFNVVPIRTGLHGLLRRSLQPQTYTNTSSVRLYEQSSLEEWCRQLLKLIEANTREEELQNFLESHVIFFHVFMPKRIFFKPPILTKYFADFAVLNARDELLLVEIEKPHLRLVKKDGDNTADLGHAFYQVRTWTQVLNEHRAAALDAIGLRIDEVARVRGVVVAGRKPADEKKLKLLRAVSTSEIELYTYDDLMSSVTELIRHVASV
jgi:hypothetical protein